MTAPEPVADAVLQDLRRRLRATRFAALPDGVGWDRGTDAGYLAELVAHWAEAYDWRPHEQRIRALPWVATTGARVIHRRAPDAGAPAVVLLHGWPDSVLRFERVLPLLADVHVVVPALPGYPFSVPAEGMSTTAMADVVAATMAELGYERYTPSGGDVGSPVAAALAGRHRERVASLHLTDVPMSHAQAVDRATLTTEEQAFVTAARRWQRSEGGYLHEQSTKPHTLAPALADSPAGLLAWIVEKLRRWMDCDGDLEAALPRDDLLTWVTAYWVTNTIGTSFSPYFEPHDPLGTIDVPTALTLFPGDIATAPRSYAERFYDLRAYELRPDGGHFAAWERPEAYVAGVRAALALG